MRDWFDPSKDDRVLLTSGIPSWMDNELGHAILGSFLLMCVTFIWRATKKDPGVEFGFTKITTTMSYGGRMASGEQIWVFKFGEDREVPPELEEPKKPEYDPFGLGGEGDNETPSSAPDPQ